MPDGFSGIEASLAVAEADAEALIVAAKRLQSVAIKARTAAQQGDLSALRVQRQAVVEEANAARAAADVLRGSWPLDAADEEAYLGSTAFSEELLRAAAEAGVGLYDRGSSLACYPSVVRIVPKEGAVTIDRKRFRVVRPSRLVRHLAAAQRREPKLRARAFLETIASAYHLLARNADGIMRLVDIHAALTLLPTARADYGQQEFVRDVYLLDASGETVTKSGHRMRLSAGATGSKGRTGLLVVVTRDGVERTYYGVEFAKEG